MPRYALKRLLTRLSTSLVALLLAGCSSSSPLIPDIFLLSLYYQQYTAVPDTSQVDYNVNQAISNIVGNAHLQARVGYFGICVNADGGSWLCSNNATALAREISVDQDPLNLIWLASQFKDMIVFPYLMYVSPSLYLYRESIKLTRSNPASSQSFLPSSVSFSSPPSPAGMRTPTARDRSVRSSRSPRGP